MVEIADKLMHLWRHTLLPPDETTRDWK